ncbi:hypothetical protein F5Y04DRAFT_226259 [Hypomontagnella monticulosa]|nr:hypothetical protein F5Y04DRAFT_226259 [Hypomontagnella monticulosa]
MNGQYRQGMPRMSTIYQRLMEVWKYLKLMFTYSTSGPIRAFLQSENNENTEVWRDAKLQELGYVGITSAILASLFASAFTWSFVPTDAYATHGCWYAGLMFILASIATATQQAITLYRFKAVGDNLEHLRNLHRKRGEGTDVSSLSVYVWQLPVMFLRFGVYLFILGMLLFLWGAVRVDHDVVLPNLRTAIAFTVILVFVGTNHFISVYLCYVLWEGT